QRAGRRILARGADGGVAARAADIVDLERVELRTLPAEEGLERDAAIDYSDHGAVLGGGVVEPVRDEETCGPRRVLRHHDRMPRNVRAQVSRQNMSPEIVLAACPEAHQQRNLFAAVEFGRSLCGSDGR